MNIRTAIDLRQQNQIAKMRFDGKTYTDELFIADKYNQFVEESILKLINDKDKNNYGTHPYLDEGEQTQEFLIMEIHREDIVKAIMNLNKKRSTDIVSDVVLSLGVNFLLEKVEEIINMSIRDGSFSQGCKQSVIIAISKKRNALEPDGFRPVNSFPFLEKVFESIMHKQLFDYVNRNNILTPNQSGFRERDSRETAL